MEILNYISAASGAIALGLFVIFRNSSQKYVDEKAKNLATIEDTQKITDEIEKVKANYLQRSHAWKYLFELEYSILKEVWGSTWEFQAHAKSLRPIFDNLPQDPEKAKDVFKERYEKYGKTVETFKDSVLKNKPFIPPHVYDSCMSLRNLVVELQVDFEMSFHDSKPDWRKINECNQKINTQLENLNMVIREHIYGKIE